MKKIVLTLAVVLCLFGLVCLAVELPPIFNEPVKNATITSNFSLSLDNADEIAALLEELELADDMEVSVEVEDFLKSIFNVGTESVVKLNASDDYSTIQMYYEESSSQKVEVNDNLSLGVDAKDYFWLDVDFSGEEPKCEIIYCGSMSNKYVVIDLFELIGNDYYEIIKEVCTAEKIDEIYKLYVDLFAKYSNVTLKDGVYTLKLDNEGFLSIINDLVAELSLEYMYAIDESLGATNDEVGIFGSEEDAEVDTYTIPDLKILGEDGIEIVYTYKKGQISAEKITIDISIDMNTMLQIIAGEDWPYETCTKIDFTITSESEYEKIGKTEIEFPELTEDNTVYYSDMIAGDDYIYSESDALPSYPSPYIWCEVDNVISVDGEFYLPLRTTMESAYEDQVFIEYMRDEAGKEYVAMISLYFPEFSTIAIEIGSETYYADTNEIALPAAMIVDGTTYVPVSFFENVLGWELGNLTYDVLYEVYNYTFWAEPVSFDMSDIDFSGLEEETIVIEEESEESDVAA